LLAVAHKHLGHCHQLWQLDVYERLAGPLGEGPGAASDFSDQCQGGQWLTCRHSASPQPQLVAARPEID
ncbi:hypothetical protein, partial [Xanthomonas translucens]